MMDKHAVHITTIKNNQQNDGDYWRARTPIERAEALEHLREQYINMNYDTRPEFQRVCRIIPK